MSDEQLGKPVRESVVEMMEQVLPNDANPLGNVLGGRVMHLIDLAGGMAAMRHCRKPVVTASVERLDFKQPIKVGEFIILKASVHYTGRTSIEVGVKVLGEHPLTGEQRHTSTAFLTYVALGPDGKPAEVPPVIPETEDEWRRYEQARQRREKRLASQQVVRSESGK